MNTNTVNPATFVGGHAPATTKASHGYRVDRRYIGERTASEVVSALMKVHDRKGAA